MTRAFITLFGLEQDQDVRRTAIAAVKAGYAVVPVAVGGKAPICILNTRELKAQGLDHPCGVSHAITDPAVADKVFKRLGKDRINIGVVAGPSRLLVVDADTSDEVDAFRADWAEAEGEGYRTWTPTVKTPGLLGDGGEWRHKDGGHFYFDLPDGVDLPWDIRGVMKHNGYDVKWGMSQTLVPPSVRAEGPYIPTGDILPAPQWLLDLVRTFLVEVEERRLHRAALTANDDVAAWAASVSWAEILEPHGWTDTGKADRSCGCPIWTKPGGGSTSYKSATAHEIDCTKYDNIEGHGPLHLWTTDPPEELMPYVLAGTQTLTKLQVVAAYLYDNDVDAAMEGLGIGLIDLDGWLVSDASDASDSTSSETVRDDARQKPETLVAQEVSASDEAVSDDLTPPKTSETSERQTDPVAAAVATAMGRNNIPASHRDKVMQSVAREMLGIAAKDAVRLIERQGLGTADGWIGTDDDIAAFLDGEEEEGPTLMHRTDGQALIYKGRTNVIVGRRGAGKTWLAMHACADALEAGLTVLYYDMEDTRQAWRTRMKSIGCDIDRHVRERRAVWKKPPDMPEDDVQPIVDYAGGFDIVVFDVVNRLVTRLGGTPDSGNREIMWLYDNLFDPLAQRHDVCVVLLDHPNKKGQRKEIESLDDLAPGGGAMKMNNASGHVIGMIPIKQFTRDDPNGDVRLYCMKDRSGHFEDGECIGVFGGDATEAIVSGTDLALSISEPPDDDDEEILTDQQQVERTIKEKIAEKGPVTKGYMKPWITRSLREWIDNALSDMQERGEVDVDDDGKWFLTETGE